MSHDEIINKTLAGATALLSESYKDKIAIIAQDTSLTYLEFDERTNQIANGLLEEGIKPAARVAFLGKDTHINYELLYGCAKAKGVLVPINWRLSPQEVLTIIEDAEAEILFVDQAFYTIISQIEEQLVSLVKIIGYNKPHAIWSEYEQWRSKQKKTTPDVFYDRKDVVLQMYTSGTTGKPKGVQLSNDSFFKLLDTMRSKHNDPWMDINGEDILLHCVPFFHIGGLWWGVQGLITGATLIMQESFIAWQALEYIEKYKITKMAMVPAMLQFILSEPNCDTTNLSSLQGFLYGGSPINPPLMRQAIEVLNCDFYQIYGMTETGNMAVCLRPEDHTDIDKNCIKAAGKPLPGVVLKVVTPDFIEVPLGTIGEICIQSPSNMIGYWKREEATKGTLIDGWIRTGDAGYLDADGYVYICDRIKDMIICSGENIYPAEVEAVLSEHEAIQEIAVIGVPDEHWGETAKAFIALNTGYSLKKRELMNYARGKIADYKIPQSIEIIERLPRNSSGKIMKRELRKPYWQEKERLVN
ncbi:long-chain-fatty-acid--CoA ligase [Aquimarina aquimarini]|uniref:long-chain-fatty-acid--CoA ligase n=1 Tax=Aquimarina aquimarini TaxID=1191734 RepID=UPI000D558A98|nr:long-chain-fatty-acid--CoA ligase [Aquimarina aquimarini]